MNKTDYLVWVNDNQFWYCRLEDAQKRARQAQTHGKDTLVVAFEVRPYIVDLKLPQKVA